MQRNGDDEHTYCPAYKDDGRISVTFTGTCALTENGSEDAGDHEYDAASDTQCGACGHVGTLADFTHAEPANEDEGA